MPQQQILTLLHISDLHFGTPGEDSDDATVSPLWRASGWFNGFFGHSYEACSALEEFWGDVQDEEDAMLVFTGDLTAHGRSDQFALGKAFIQDRATFRSRSLGLRAANYRDRSISGNHDQWPGSPSLPGLPWIWGWRSPGVDLSFHSFHFETRLRGLSSTTDSGQSLTVRLFGIDTDADVGPFSRKRLLAQGSFKSQLIKLGEELGDSANDGLEVRVLLLHHAPAHRQRGGVGEIDKESLDELWDFAKRHDIAVMMSGHTHYPRIVNTLEQSNLGPFRYLDAQCGTTTQRAQLPEEWVGDRMRRRQKRLVPNTLLLHRIIVDDGALVWRAETWVYHPRYSRRFELAEASETPIGLADLSGEIKI
jgi:3',5'-cyclic AMP phosphodiesterase CpdA